MGYLLGIDDAGRGPVIGPMILAGVLIKKEDLPKLKALKVKDSKQLTQPQREKLAIQIEKISEFEIIKTYPEEIDSAVQGGLNLNRLEAVKMANIVNSLAGKKEAEIIIDCPSVNILAWKNYLLTHIDSVQNKHFIVEHKADERYAVCSAASILAKVAREKEIALIKKRLGIEFGSGYPADPITIEFLRKSGKKYEKQGIIRKSWQTWQAIKKKSSQRNLF